MGKKEKLYLKLMAGTLTVAEARVLMQQFGCVKKRQSGSHETWKSPEGKIFILAAHQKELKDYQIKGIQKLLGGLV
jgi:predicted RNA binding protein YcfA (HicA-like mRNA interferase family)